MLLNLPFRVTRMWIETKAHLLDWLTCLCFSFPFQAGTGNSFFRKHNRVNLRSPNPNSSRERNCQCQAEVGREGWSWREIEQTEDPRMHPHSPLWFWGSFYCPGRWPVKNVSLPLASVARSLNGYSLVKMTSQLNSTYKGTINIFMTCYFLTSTQRN